jgi:hypothetical protein
MRTVRSIFIRSLVKPFYRKNAGFFVFVFTLLFAVINRLNDEQEFIWSYHYHLILGMLNSPGLTALVFLAWLIYADKCYHFITGVIRHPDYSFLNMLNQSDTRTVFQLLLRAQGWLFLPVTGYALVIAGVAARQGRYDMSVLVLLYVALLCLLSTRRYLYLLRNPGKHRTRRRTTGPRHPRTPYRGFLLRYLLHERKALFLGIKLFSCAMLYFLTTGVAPADYDIRMPFLFYSIGLFGHGVLLYRFREFEERRLAFYRGMPVSLSRRFLQYALLCLLLFIPEMITISWLTPHALHYGDALRLAFSGYGLLIFLNCILLAAPVRMTDFLKELLLIYGVLYFCAMAGLLFWLAGCLLVLAVVLFATGYYRYEASHP